MLLQLTIGQNRCNQYKLQHSEHVQWPINLRRAQWAVRTSIAGSLLVLCILAAIVP
jgi:hypothetical protein